MKKRQTGIHTTRKSSLLGIGALLHVMTYGALPQELLNVSFEGSITDSSSNNHPLINGPIAFADGPYGDITESAQFLGANSIVNGPTDSVLFGTSGIVDFTLTCWFKLESTNNQHIISFYDSTSGADIPFLFTFMLDGSGRLAITSRDQNGTVSRLDLDENPENLVDEWHYLTLIFSQNTNQMEAYIDGTFADADSLTSNSYIDGGQLLLGANRYNNILYDGYQGQLDDLIIASGVHFGMITPPAFDTYVALRFDGDLADASPSQHTFVAGPIDYSQSPLEFGGDALDFLGNNSVITGPSDSTIFETTGNVDFTLSFWLYLEDTNNQHIISFYDSSFWADPTFLMTFMIDGSGRLAATARDTNGITSRIDIHNSPSTLVGTWRHFAIVFNQSGGSLNGYFEGSLVDSAPLTSASYIDGGQLRLGANVHNGTTHDGFEGGLENVIFYEGVRIDKTQP